MPAPVPYPRTAWAWDGVANTVSSFTVDQMTDHAKGLPAPSLAFNTGTADHLTFVEVPAPLSARFYVQHPGVTAAYNFARVLNAELKSRTGGTPGYVVNVVGVGVVGTLATTPGAWTRFEFNATTGTSIRIRAWTVGADASEALIFDYSTSAMTSRAGGNFGVPVAAAGTIGTVRYDHVLVTRDAQNVGPAPHLPPRVAQYTGGTRADVETKGIVTGGAATGLRLTGIYETRASDVRYYDTAPVLAGIDAATDVAGLRTALAPLATAYDATINLHTSDVTQTLDGATVTAQALTLSTPKLKPFLRYMVDMLALCPPDTIRLGQPITIHLGSSLTYGGSAASGVCSRDGAEVWYSVQPTDYQLTTVGPSDAEALPSLFMHELGHSIVFTASGGGAYSQLESEFAAAQPPGFTYMGSSYTEPFTGEHPPGFVRGYGRASFDEDTAEIFSFLTAPAVFPRLLGWAQDDPYLRSKIRAMKRFLAARWFGPYLIEEAHGSVPQVRPL